MSATILFYSAQKAPLAVYEAVFNQILKVKPSDSELIAVTQNGEPRADVDIVLQQDGSSHKNQYERILEGAEKATNDVVCLAEDDVLYPSGYFQQAEKEQRENAESLCYNYSLIRLDGNGWANAYGRGRTFSLLTTSKQALIWSAKNRLKLIMNGKQYKSGEFSEVITRYWHYWQPCVDIRHSANMTGNRLQEPFHWNTYTRTHSYWGNALEWLKTLHIDEPDIAKVWNSQNKAIEENSPPATQYETLTIATCVRDSPIDYQVQMQNYCSFHPELLDRIEFIFIDDGSAEPLPFITYQPQNMNVIHHRRRRLNGWSLAEARNAAIKLASSKRILLIDVDMILTEEEAVKLIKEYNDNQPTVYFPQRVIEGNEGHQRIQQGKNQFSARVEDLKKVDGYDEDFSGSYGYEDEDLRLRLSEVTDFAEMNVKLIDIGETGKGKGKDLKRNARLFRAKNRMRVEKLTKKEFDSQNPNMGEEA